MILKKTLLRRINILNVKYNLPLYLPFTTFFIRKNSDMICYDKNYKHRLNV